MPLAFWPLTVPAGNPPYLTPNFMGSAIVLKCEQRLAEPMLPADQQLFYRLILAHAQFDSTNSAHGLLRSLVDINGRGVHGDPDLILAWNQTKLAYDKVVLIVLPTIADLAEALSGNAVTQGIDHGGAG